MRIHHTTVTSVLAAVVFVSVITCIDIVTLSAGPPYYRNETDRWLPGLLACQRKKKYRIRQINYRVFVQVIVQLSKRSCRLDTRGVRGVSSTEIGLMQEVSKWVYVNLHYTKSSTGHILHTDSWFYFIPVFISDTVARLAHQDSETLYCMHLQF
jgi:hypothetical protein